MTIKLTQAQIKLISAMRGNPGTDAKEHLKHIRNQAIADDMIAKLLKFGVLQVNPETKQKELAPTYQTIIAVTETPNEDIVEEIPNVEFTTGAEVNELPEGEADVVREQIPPQKANKKAIILEMLKAKASLKDMMDATGWKEKSVRGVISQLKKEKKLDIRREKGADLQKSYYIASI